MLSDDDDDDAIRREQERRLEEQEVTDMSVVRLICYHKLHAMHDREASQHILSLSSVNQALHFGNGELEWRQKNAPEALREKQWARYVAFQLK